MSAQTINFPLLNLPPLFSSTPSSTGAAHAHSITTDSQIVSSVRDLISALTSADQDETQPRFTSEINRLQPLLKADQAQSTEATQHAMRDAMLEIFGRVKTDISQLSLQEIKEALPRLPQIHREGIEVWLFSQFSDGFIEADRKEQRASESVALPSLNPGLYIACRYLLTDAKIQNSFDANLVQFAIRVDERFRFETNLQTALAHQSMATQAEAIRAWFKFHQSQEAWTGIRSLSLENFPQSKSFDVLMHGGHVCRRTMSGPAVSMKLSWEIVALLKSMPNLEWLYLNSNELIALPDAIGDLPQLKYLTLSDNRLKVLPKTIGKLTKLSNLGLGFNQLQTLPAIIGNLTQLAQLNLHSNQLQALPESIGLCKQLRWVDLASNPLRSVPQTLGDLKKFKYLHLSSDQKGELSDTIKRLCPSCKISVPAPAAKDGSWKSDQLLIQELTD